MQDLQLAEDHPQRALVTEALAHLEPSHLHYFARWVRSEYFHRFLLGLQSCLRGPQMRWLCLEWAADLKQSPATEDIWRKTPQQRYWRGFVRTQKLQKARLDVKFKTTTKF